MDRLSPSIAPLRHAAITIGRFNPALSTTPSAIGTSAATVPIDVPVAMDRNPEIRKIPTVSIEAGMMETPRLTVESIPPIALATVENAPARR